MRAKKSISKEEKEMIKRLQSLDKKLTKAEPLEKEIATKIKRLSRILK